MDADDYYAWLGIDAGADAAAIRRAWRKLAIRWHPDRAGRDTTFIFQKLSRAYEVLSDPVAREAYNRQRGREGSGGGASDTGSRTPAAMLSRLCGHLNALAACGIAHRDRDDVVELYLNPQEAADGGMVTIAMSVSVRCPACAADRTAACTRCRSTRVVEDLYSAWLAIPPGVGDGTMVRPSAVLPDMVRPVRFRVRLPVQK